MVRKSWLERGPGAATHKRGADPFVAVSWDEAERLVAQELDRVRRDHGNQAIYGGSYGWSSAGRFHHAQSQIHRFLNSIGGYTRSVNSYSVAAAEVILAHVMGDINELAYLATPWRSIIEHSQLVVAFGGLPIKNGQVGQGGVGAHNQRRLMTEAASAGIQFVNVSPIRSDVLDELDAEWLPARPSTDTALMLALAHSLVDSDLVDRDFVDRCTVGFDRFADYLLGRTDSTPKSAEWAASICGIDAETIRELAHRMAHERTMISISWSLSRQDHGEQTYWAAVALAAMLGQIGLPGGGIGFGYTAEHCIGNDYTGVPAAALPQGERSVDAFIPVARIADMLLGPGTDFDYNGQRYTYPDIRVVYWAGGNPFHHHQDLNKLLEAWRRPDTIIVHDWCWNASTKHADIVLPCTTAIERKDLALTRLDPYIVAMDQVIEPVGQSRDDYNIFAGIARHLGHEETFTEGRSAADWIEWLYDRTRERAARNGIELPSLTELEAAGWCELPPSADDKTMLADFRADPSSNPLATPSGRIELYSEVVASYRYDDCPGHPTWLEPSEWLGSIDNPHPLHLISNQPSTKLHSQLDHGSISRAAKINGREPVSLHPDDAAARGIRHHNLVRVFNDRGACLASAVIDDRISASVVQIATGAWYDPAQPGQPGSICKHGNPNMLTLDKGTSRLAQGPTAHSCLVDIERFDDEPPPITAFRPPAIIPDAR